MDSLYDDIDIIADSAQTRKLQEELNEIKKVCAKKDKEIEDLVTQTQVLIEDKDKLECNIVRLFNTATAEIKRKDKEIAELRASISSIRRADR